VVEVRAIGQVDRLAVLDPLRDHEPGVEDRHGENDQREYERDDRVRLQRALHGDRREEVAEQVRAGVAQEDGGRVKAVAQVAERGAGRDGREDRRGVPVERQRDHPEGDRRDRADPRSQPVDAVDEVHDVHHRDDPRDRQRIRQVAELHTPDERHCEVLHPHAAGHRNHRREDLAQQLHVGRQVEQVIRRADNGDHRRAGQDPARLVGRVEEHEAAGSDRGEDRHPAEARRREDMETALARRVDRADPPCDPAGHRGDDPRDDQREREGAESGVEVAHPARG